MMLLIGKRINQHVNDTITSHFHANCFYIFSLKNKLLCENLCSATLLMDSHALRKDRNIFPRLTTSFCIWFSQYFKDDYSSTTAIS